MRIPPKDTPSAPVVPLTTTTDKLPIFKPDPTSSGQIPYNIPGISKPCFTAYKIFGHLPSAKSKFPSSSASTAKLPIIFLHGGPGACHEYLLPFVDLYEKYGHPCIFYDQIGNGASTRLREKKGDESFFTVQLFVDELDNLIDHFNLRENGFYILGQSWGGMLGSDYATRNPKGLKRLVIANSPASMKLWVKGCNRLIKDLPEETQEAIRYSLKTGDYETKEFEAANDLFSRRHLYRVETGGLYPGPHTGAAEWHLKEDDTVYGTMNGPVEFIILGNLSSWSVIDRLHKIDIPVLTYHGQYDEATDESVKPFFENIRKVKWVTVDGASHMAHIERRERVMGLVADFLG